MVAGADPVQYLRRNCSIINHLCKILAGGLMDYVKILEECDEDHWVQLSIGNHGLDLDIMALICWLWICKQESFLFYVEILWVI